MRLCASHAHSAELGWPPAQSSPATPLHDRDIRPASTRFGPARRTEHSTGFVMFSASPNPSPYVQRTPLIHLRNSANGWRHTLRGWLHRYNVCRYRAYPSSLTPRRACCWRDLYVQLATTSVGARIGAANPGNYNDYFEISADALLLKRVFDPDWALPISAVIATEPPLPSSALARTSPTSCDMFTVVQHGIPVPNIYADDHDLPPLTLLCPRHQ
jgi:hypothetical protein